jgi:hypothetical protein
LIFLAQNHGRGYCRARGLHSLLHHDQDGEKDPIESLEIFLHVMRRNVGLSRTLVIMENMMVDLSMKTVKTAA